MKTPALKFHWFIVCWALLATAITLAAAGTVIFLIRDRQTAKETSAEIKATTQSLAVLTEGLLASVEQSLIILANASRTNSRADFSELLVSSLARQPLIRSMYFLDSRGKTFAIWSQDIDNPLHSALTGIDLSYTPLYQRIQGDSAPVWSDKFVSTIAGDTAIGVGIRIGSHAAIAELELSTLLQTVETASSSLARIWVLDRLGEVLADTGQRSAAGLLNIRNEPAIDLALQGGSLPQTIRLFKKSYHCAAARSEKLGWLFIGGIPAGFDNPSMKNTLTDITLFCASFFLITLLLSLIFVFIVSSQLGSLAHLVNRIGEGNEQRPKYREGAIREFNDLSRSFIGMADRIAEREQSLRELNQELEQRVAERTRELQARNDELNKSVEINTEMRELLVQAEKLAALGRLVAGIAHELNTPVGNAVMALSTLQEERRLFGRAAAEGLRKSTLERFLAQSEQGLEIAGKNVARAAELITSFKHVASDQTSSVRRKFELRETIQDVLLTLRPMFKRTPHQLETDIEPDVQLDSYPGVLGQIVTNLLSNALLHAFDERRAGRITLTAKADPEQGRLHLAIADNGKGIPASQHKKIFEPFFTTRMGSGGTGLGLNIAYNGARNVLGGTLRFESGEGQGTVFILDIPLVAPSLRGAAEGQP